MGKHLIASLLLIFLLFFLPWLWSGPSGASPPADTPPAGDAPVQDLDPAPQPEAGWTSARR